MLSTFCLPDNYMLRKEIYKLIKKNKKSLHFIFEELSFKKDGDSNIAFDFKKEFSRIAMPINTQVNFSAMSLDAPLYDPKDSPKYLVLSSILRNEFLHRKVREQGGAYGGGAIYDPFAGSFKLFSYRDPRFLETFEDFEESFKWAAQGCLLYTSPSPRDRYGSRMPSSA